MQSQKRLTFTTGSSELVDLEFFVPVPDGFHACQDRSIIGESRSLVIVPEDYSFYADPMEAEFALSIQSNTLDVPVPISPKTKDVYIQFFQNNTSLFDETPVVDVRIREGAGALYQFAGGADWLKIFGVFFCEKTGYLFHLIWNHQKTEEALEEIIEELYEQAGAWLGRIHRPGEEEAPRFQSATPDKSLYPHYEHIQNASRGLPGVTMVVNENGTEYEFIALKNMDPEICGKIAGAPLQPFPLADTAWEMAGLFRVDQSVFDPKHDRECQLKNRYMHRAYMMSALRSFFWTVCAYCEESSVTPEQLTLDDIRGIVEHIAARQWLNYADDDYGSNICSIQDCHVYYVPEEADMDDQRAMMLADLVENTSNIPSDLTYLEELREDLEYIYPAIRTIYDELAEDRDPYEQLTGNLADVLYAWCALTIAAKEPFYSEDGPVKCYFEQRKEETLPAAVKTHCKQAQLRSTVSDTIPTGAKQLRPEDCYIDDDGVFYEYDGYEPIIILPKTVQKIGSCCSLSDSVTTVIIPDGVTFIGEDAFMGCTSLTSITIPDSVTSIQDGAFKICTGLKTVTLPGSLASIGEDAFMGCTSLTSITLPDSLTFIGDNAFQDCVSLASITIPDSVTSIQDGTFRGCTGLKTVTLPGEIDINALAFSDCTEGITLIISEGHQSIPTLGLLRQYVSKVLIPDGVTSIKDWTFFGCDSLTSITLPGSLASIGKAAFPEQAVLQVVKGSWAEQYCIEKSLCHNALTSGEMAIFYKEADRKRQEEERLRREAEEAERKRQEEERLRREAEEAESKRQEEERLRREAEEAERKRQEEERLRREAEEAERKRQEEERLRREAEEAERKRQKELAERHARYDELSKAISQQMEIIAQNKGWFGAQAKARKAAQNQLEILLEQQSSEFPNGMP